ncbi:hypothetical protein OESDEN_05540 [Oesophagostomum dentatum]|uniref:Uncharacterized protein n=1 Tax=Oesophagostomum dentatum TaxID=61180 RepID=A0A0B1TGJ4_OESDE|nr:hypothetical protein OESDEN_05540 [Oesophagostomum dentatum]
MQLTDDDPLQFEKAVKYFAKASKVKAEPDHCKAKRQPTPAMVRITVEDFTCDHMNKFMERLKQEMNNKKTTAKVLEPSCRKAPQSYSRKGKFTKKLISSRHK